MRYSLIIMVLYCSYQAAAQTQFVYFEDKTLQLEYVFGTMGQAKCAADMNGDWLDDVTRVAADGIHIDFQQTDGSFKHKFIPKSMQVLPSWSICAGDLDNNGANDLLFGGENRVAFLRNEDAGADFTEFVMPANIYSQRSTLFDIDQDGFLDAFVCRDDGQSQTFRNNGNGTMTLDQSLLNTSSLPGNYSAIWTDYNNDGFTDLYISKCLINGLPGNPARTNLLYHNNGDGTFTEKGAAAGLADNAQSWSTAFEDFDNDGDFDAFVVNHDQGNRFFRNNGNATFTNIITSTYINEFDLGAWENTTGDFNNDGYLDIFSELHQQLYLGHGDLTFTGQPLPFTPGAIGDFNNDGFLDVTYKSQLWINKGNANHWIKFNLRGIESNRNGIGARIEIYGSWGIQTRELRAGQGFSPMNTLSVHFGLGQAAQIDKVLVRWPAGTVTEILNPAVDTIYVIPESACVRAGGNISLSGNPQICPGAVVTLTAPAGFTEYIWSNGANSQEIQIEKPGRYDVITIDSMGCARMSAAVETTIADLYMPEITVPDGLSRVCEGMSVQLISSAGNNTQWSNGVQNSAQITVTSSGYYSAAIDSVCNTGQLLSTPVFIEFLPAPAPQIQSVTVGIGDSVLLQALGENCAWYKDASGGNALASGCSYQMPPLYADTVLYVESQYQYPGEIQYGAKPDSLGFGLMSTSNRSLHFTAWEPFTLLTVDVYVPAQASAGTRNFQLLSGNEILADTAVFLNKGKNVVPLGFAVPPGNLTLKCLQSDQFLNVGNLDYPYPIGNVGQIDSSSAGLNFYPYCYNWKIQKPDHNCVSERTQVSIQVSANTEQHLQSPFHVFPVPADAQLNVIVHGVVAPECVVLLLDISGKTVIRQTFDTQNQHILNTSGLPAGVYELMIKTSQNTWYKTILINH